MYTWVLATMVMNRQWGKTKRKIFEGFHFVTKLSLHGDFRLRRFTFDLLLLSIDKNVNTRSLSFHFLSQRRLIDWLNFLMHSFREYLTHTISSRAAMLGSYNLWAGRDLCCAILDLTRNLRVSFDGRPRLVAIDRTYS